MSAPRTPLCDRLGIDRPILLAGMGGTGRETPPELVAAVSNSGGLGTLGCAYLAPDEVRRRIRAVRALTDRPFGVNLLLPASLAEATPDREVMRDRIARDFPDHAALVRSIAEAHGLAVVDARKPVLEPDLIRQQVAVVLEERVPVFAAGLGDPAWVVQPAHEIGTFVIGLAGSVRHAVRQVAAGVDAIVAQGTEAGGHTGRIGTLALIPQVVDAITPLPVIAAGGIGDGRGLVAALALGAQAVWCGTAFLLADECQLPAPLQQQILDAPADDFVLTRSYTGKNARDVRNTVIATWDASGLDPLPMPLQGILMEDLVAAAEAAGLFDLVNNPAGQIGGMITRRRPAAEILGSMVEEAEAILDRFGRGG